MGGGEIMMNIRYLTLSGIIMNGKGFLSQLVDFVMLVAL
jgi:hypothetical protein